jgi:hypothetical protein
MPLFANAPAVSFKKKASPKPDMEAVVLAMAKIIDPVAFIADPDDNAVSPRQQQYRITAIRKARSCLRVYEENRPKRTVVIAQKGRKIYRKV